MAGFRKIHLITLLVILLLVYISYTQFRKNAPFREPAYNIVFIGVDDLRPELPVYGKEHIIAPNMDRLASAGLVFNRAYCQMAVCNPSRISLMTGLRPDSTRIFNNGTHLRETLPDIRTLPQFFKEHGYYSVGIGKLYHGLLNDTLSWSEPWWIPYDFQKNRGYVLDQNKGIAKGNRGRGYPCEAADTNDLAYPDGMIAERAVGKLEELKNNQPFFLGVGFHKPHLPFAVPEKYWDLYAPGTIQPSEILEPPEGAPAFAGTNWGELRNYAGVPKTGPVSDSLAIKLIHGYRASVSYVDAQIGRLLDALESSGLQDNTIIVLWGDHGWKLGEYGSWCKHTNYEFDTRTVLIISGPGMKMRGRKSDALVELVDIYPTLVDLAGLKLPRHLQGVSLVPLLKAPDIPWNPLAISQYPRGKLMGYSYRTEKYRLVVWKDKNQEIQYRELYDHRVDSFETKNLAGIPGNERIIEEILNLVQQ